jgi:putative membrane-bound dehydrogenase-like protein
MLSMLAVAGRAAAQPVPHNQDRAPGPALSPKEALARFKLPEGFRVELLASEPDIVNPIKMCFDARGRIWLVESLEYPRSEAGPGQDRVKLLEDTDGDGKPDRFSVFADGLNIPCGIAVGHGGVFVTNAPDVLFLEDTDGDGRADRREVLFTGFGRHDTHELPNTLTWGPDGWLYGLNGVFNPAKIEHQGKTHEFTCALWRYHPRTRAFEVFAEGTSNPWGVGFDREGAAFVEACVIDHLYHLTETGYYHRQGGPYPPFTWKIESIVKHRFYKAAYCGLDFYDADVYPEPYRNLVYFGNIHGTCINADSLERDGATYFAKPGPTILQTDDAWFMPVDVRLAPDGCFHVLDWYDRYHCYQDARRDPKGIDRGRGRLWRIAYGDAARPAPFDLEKEPSAALIARLGAPNRWWRDTARRILGERRDAASYPPLKKLVLDEGAPRAARLQALWTLIGCEDPGAAPRALDGEFPLQVLALKDPGLRAWGVRAAGDQRRVGAQVEDRVAALAADLEPDVRLQAAIAARKLFDAPRAALLLLETLSRSEKDPLIPKIVWRNLEPLMETEGPAVVAWLEGRDRGALAGLGDLLGRMVDRLLARREGGAGAVVRLVGLLLRDLNAHAGASAQCLDALGRAHAGGEIDAASLEALQAQLSRHLLAIASRGPKDALFLPAFSLAAGWKEPIALAALKSVLQDAKVEPALRARALRGLLGPEPETVLEFASGLLKAPAGAPRELILEALSSLGRLEEPRIAPMVLSSLETLPADVQPQALDLLCQRPAWAKALLDRVAEGKIDARRFNVTQLRRLNGLGDEEISRRVLAVWGAVREERNPDREQVIARMKRVLAQRPGDPWKGKAVFEKTCAQCHLLFGQGQTVGPDITVNGRETLELLLSNLLDPNLVIGKDYFARTLLTKDGRVLNGLLVEDSPQRVVLKVAGGKEEAVPRREVQALTVSPVSLMPEDLEKTTSEDEFRDLIAFLRFDEPPPEPIALPEAARGGGDGAIAIVDAGYGRLRVEARFPGAAERVELFTYEHSNDQRPFVHPLRAPGGGPALTALRPEDHPWQYGVFTGHARVNGLDFWHEKGWIRSRGLVEASRRGGGVSFTSRSDWLTERRGGQRILVEEQVLTVPAPERDDRYAIDFEWRLTPDVDVVIDRYEYGGLAVRPAEHSERRHETHASGERRAWQDVSGRFGRGDRAVAAGVAIFDHPKNPGFPNRWRVDGQGLINPAITAFEPLRLPAGKTTAFRYRLIVHRGHGDAKMLDAEFERWAPGGRAKAGG